MDEFELGHEMDLDEAADYEAALDRRGGVEAAFRAVMREEMEPGDDF